MRKGEHSSEATANSSPASSKKKESPKKAKAPLAKKPSQAALATKTNCCGQWLGAPIGLCFFCVPCGGEDQPCCRGLFGTGGGGFSGLGCRPPYVCTFSGGGGPSVCVSPSP